MSLLTRENRITVKSFASVPELLNLPSIEREKDSVSVASSLHLFEPGRIPLEEGCLLTKSVKYTHQLAHFVNAVRAGDPDPVDVIQQELDIVGFDNFDLDHPCNLTCLEPFVHASLDLYAFIAISPSLSTVQSLIHMVKSDNDLRQEQMDRTGRARKRILDFEDPNVTDPEYELVALHPEHFLPRGSVLPIYDPTTQTCKYYVPSSDQRLRETCDPTSPALPPFRHTLSRRNKIQALNIFLVSINAEIKFRRYFRMIKQHPPEPTQCLPDDVIKLMTHVIELVDLLYWKPRPTVGSQGYYLHAEVSEGKCKKLERADRLPVRHYSEATCGEETENRSRTKKLRKRKRVLPDADVATRMAYGTALMFGHDFDYDPALFEDAFPIDESARCFDSIALYLLAENCAYEVPHLYSDSSKIKQWSHEVRDDLEES